MTVLTAIFFSFLFFCRNHDLSSFFLRVFPFYLFPVFQELTQREVEYVSLSRDTTESDLKQRREIQDGTAFYVDQAAVRAALEGRVLILDGIEKAERNVLPVLNNLLENRSVVWLWLSAGDSLQGVSLPFYLLFMTMHLEYWYSEIESETYSWNV